MLVCINISFIHLSTNNLLIMISTLYNITYNNLQVASFLLLMFLSIFNPTINLYSLATGFSRANMIYVFVNTIFYLMLFAYWSYGTDGKDDIFIHYFKRYKASIIKLGMGILLGINILLGIFYIFTMTSHIAILWNLLTITAESMYFVSYMPHAYKTYNMLHLLYLKKIRYEEKYQNMLNLV